MRRIVYERPDGGISIVCPAFNMEEPEGWTEADSEKRAWDRLPADAISPRFVEESEIPQDRTFRNAWSSQSNGAISVDMVKAAEIHKEKLREMRKPLLEKLDVDFIRAVEAGDPQATATVAAKKQVLRDVTNDPAIAAAKTPEELKQAIPPVLLADTRLSRR